VAVDVGKSLLAATVVQTVDYKDSQTTRNEKGSVEDRVAARRESGMEEGNRAMTTSKGEI
jgi:hypothetical protein